jgi:hypothetical protein
LSLLLITLIKLGIYSHIAFPPHVSIKDAPENPLVEIQDPWVPVSTYAEDYYAGGEVPQHPKEPLSAHYLGVNDDGSGFLSPDVVSNIELASDEGAEQEDEVEEDYEDGVEDETRETEPEEFSEHDHLFNRLQSSYTRHSFVCGDMHTSLNNSHSLSGRSILARPASTLRVKR